MSDRSHSVKKASAILGLGHLNTTFMNGNPVVKWRSLGMLRLEIMLPTCLPLGSSSGWGTASFVFELYTRIVCVGCGGFGTEGGRN